MTDTPHSSVPYVPGRLGGEPTTDQIPASPPPWTTGQVPVQPPTPPTRPRRTALLVGLLAAVTAVAVAAGIGGFLLLRGGKTPLEAVRAVAAPGPYRITGTVSLARGYDGMTNCGGTGGYKDIRVGTQVAVSDSDGSTIAIGRLEVGTVTSGRGCVLPFTVANVPSGKGFYGIEVSHRGILRYAEDEFSTRNLDLTLG